MKIGILGSGTMGVGIAQTFAQSKGYEIVICGSTPESGERGKEKINKRLNSRIKKGKIGQEEAEEILLRINPGYYRDCQDCEMIIEAIPENLELKQKLFRQMQNICGNDCIFASNTSSLSITEIGMKIKQPVIGMHFFNPAPVMKLVEIIPGLNTPRKTVDFVTEMAKKLGKVPVEVKENAGLVVNRVLIPMINEAIGLYAEGIASVEGIDTAMKLGANHPMGPLELGDFIGLDICLAIMQVIQEETGDSKYRPHPLLRKMVRGGWLGVKSGRGFYLYKDGKRVSQ